ncbi:hypothetical protein B0H14DRAFT_2591000 [Mycena olivaceomarginata]|nr:hypothetical protein B0H14DRAFT_2591000 [Mycena olivaceomarginata]
MWRDIAKTFHRDTFLGLAIRTARAPPILNVRPGSLIKYAFDDEGAIEHKENTLNLLATMTLPVSVHADHVLKPPQNPIPHPNEAIFKDWYTFSDPPPLYSRDWANWDGMEMRLPCLNSTLRGVDASINIPYQLLVPIEPLIFYDPEEYSDGAEGTTAHTSRLPHFYVRSWTLFSVHAPQNPRMEELAALRMKFEEWTALHEEKGVMFRNPPPNELYTEIFPWED